MFKNKSGYARLDSPVRRADYSAYSAESSRDSNGQTFHFTSLDTADDELLDDHGFELRSRASGAALSSMAAPPPIAGSERTEHITHDITSEDTLQTISLKYSVPISELKRANTLYSEKELCARRFIRIPVRPNSVLTDEPRTEQLVCLEPVDSGDCGGGGGGGGRDGGRDGSGRLSPGSADSRGSAGSTEVRPFGDGVHEGHKLLKNVDRELTAVKAKADELRAEGVLAAGGIAADTGSAWIAAAPRKGGLCSGSGADWGVHWLCLLAIALLMLVVVPVWYIVREYETDNLGHHHHHTNSGAHSTPSGGGGL